MFSFAKPLLFQINYTFNLDINSFDFRVPKIKKRVKRDKFNDSAQ